MQLNVMMGLKSQETPLSPNCRCHIIDVIFSGFSLFSGCCILSDMLNDASFVRALIDIIPKIKGLFGSGPCD